MGSTKMDEALRPAALQALNDAPFRVVALTRSPEMVQATSEAWFVEAVAVQLHDLTGPEAADYLQRARTGPPPSGWTELLTHLREHPDGLLARGLSTPLTLTLLRDTYHGGDDVGDLLDTTRDGTAERIERRLITRVLPAAYTPRPGRPPPRYSEAQARQALTFLARRMNQDHTRDLAWWHIPRWASTMPRVFTAGLRNGLAYGPAFGLVLGLVLGLTFGLVNGKDELMVWFVVVVGSILGIMGGLVIGTMFGIMGGLQVKLATGRLGSYKSLEPRRIRIANWRAVVSRKALGQALSAGLVFGFGFQEGPRSGLVAGLTLGLFGMLVVGFTEGGTAEGPPLGPREIWRNDGVAWLLSGLLFGLLFGLVGGLAGGLNIEFGLTFGLMPTLFAVLYSTRTITTLAWRQLKLAGHVPAVGLMAFLADARERGVLRTVGGVYQFRHATLQDQLADQTTPNSAVSRVS